MNEPFFSIRFDDTDTDLLHVQMSSATEMSFDLSLKGLDFNDVFREICFVVPSIMKIDAALMEMMDGENVEAQDIDILKVNRFARKYKSALSNIDVYVTEQFGGDVP